MARSGCSIQTARMAGNSSPRRIGGFDRQSAGHGAETLVLADGAEEARALEGRDFCQTLAVVLRHQHAKSGKTDVADIGRHRKRAEVELFRVVDDAAGLPLRDEIDGDGGGENEAAVERLERETEILVCPDEGRGFGPDRDILVVGKLAKRVRNVAGDRLIGLLRRGAGHIGDEARMEWCRSAERETRSRRWRRWRGRRRSWGGIGFRARHEKRGVKIGDQSRRPGRRGSI